MPPEGYGLAAMVDDLRGLFAHLGIVRAHLVGHSFGGAVTLAFAQAEAARVRTLTLADARIPALQPTARVEDVPLGEAWWQCVREAGIEVPADQPLDFTVFDVLADPRWAAARRRLADAGLFVPFGGWNSGRRGAERWRRLLATTSARADFAAEQGPAVDGLEDLDVPVLLVYGEHSHCGPSAAGLARRLLRATSVSVLGAGHFHPSVHPRFFAEVLHDFLGRHAMPTKRILLVSPHADNEALWVTGDEELCGQYLNNFVPLGLATVAALAPPEFEIDIWDELVHGKFEATTPLPKPYDLVGVTGYKAHLPRCSQLARLFRARGIPVAIGGPGVSASPDEYRSDFDILFVGEAEETWPEFLRDWTAGTQRREYRQIAKLDLAQSPKPRWNSIAGDLGKYAFGGVQTTRGCPFDCEFCDVIYLYGRRARHKPIPQVLEEIEALERLGMSTVFFADDEFIGDPRYTKELLRALVPLNNSFARPLSYSTQLTMNLSRDEEMLALMADANFDLVFIGIETPNKESLRETHKMQNVRDDLVADVHKILAHGISIRSGIIVGFDHDDATIFDTVYDFIQAACLPSLAVNMLKAPLGTRLWQRLRLEGRVLSTVSLVGKGHPRTYTNIIPKRMSRVELVRGYGELLDRVNTWDAFEARVRGFVSLVKRAPRVRETPLAGDEALRLLATLAVAPEGRASMERIVRHTERTAPFMMRRVKRLIVQHAAYHTTLARFQPQFARQIALETSPDFVLAPDDRAIPIPPAFRAAFPRLFPDVHRRVFLNLRDKRQVPEALTEVFVDFLVRWGDDFVAFEPHHREFLLELADRTCAQMNGEPPERFVPVEDDAGAEVPDVRRLRLGEDVLRSVDQELVRFARAEAN